MREHGKRVVERWNDLGILGRLELLPRTASTSTSTKSICCATPGPTSIHNPQSNMGNAVGCAPVLEMMRRGVRVGLGTDGYTADMFESMKAANLLAKASRRRPARRLGRAARRCSSRRNAAIAIGVLRPSRRQARSRRPRRHHPGRLRSAHSAECRQSQWPHPLRILRACRCRATIIGGQMSSWTTGNCSAIDEQEVMAKATRRCRGVVEALLEKTISRLPRHNGRQPSFPAARSPEVPPMSATNFHVLAKPIGPICNLDCKYCFYLEKESLYPQVEKWAMQRRGAGELHPPVH